jgi:hypothetical protein
MLVRLRFNFNNLPELDITFYRNFDFKSFKTFWTYNSQIIVISWCVLASWFIIFFPDRPRERSAESGDPDLYDISETVRLPDDQHQRLRRRIRAGDNLIKLFTSVSYQFS